MMKTAHSCAVPRVYILAVSALVAATIPGCGSDQGPITSQTTKYEADDASEPSATPPAAQLPAVTQPPEMVQPPADSLTAAAEATAATDVGGTAIPMPPGGLQPNRRPRNLRPRRGVPPVVPRNQAAWSEYPSIPARRVSTRRRVPIRTRRAARHPKSCWRRCNS